ncbi:MAG: diacylglycerol kinase family protein [Propionicimonas sp.]|uniref:diacylglycerol/lipid kinase family protein n=1 Tax=Propionicimonas sp. TaxID=1955623 RepID=UPI003D11FA8C
MSLRYDGPTLTLVVNPEAGRGRARRLLPPLTAGLVAGLPEANLHVHQTTSFSDARLRCIQAVEQARPAVEGHRRDALVVMGGDGMMHLGLNAAAGTDVPLGLVAAGRGNDFCRGVGVPNDLAGAIRTIVDGHTLRMDLMEARGRLSEGAERRWVGSIVSTGFDARVNYRTNHLRWNLGQLSYTWAALAELSRFEPVPYRLVIDGIERTQTAMFVAVGNAGWFGGGMQGCVGADVADGLLDLTIVHPVSRFTLLRLLPRMFDGGYVRDPAVEQLRAREVVVDGDGLFGMADGEELGPVPLHLRAVPDSLSVFVPAAVATS